MLRGVGRRCFAGFKSDVRVRFAPSPTGFLHLGGLRTALYNYLFAKARNGAFILRVEDTDQSRIVPGALDQLQVDLKWAGIDVHEGPQTGGPTGPYIQSQRLDIYRDHIQLLLDNGTAYKCFCTERRLDLLRKEAIRARELPKYDNRCRSITLEDAEARVRNGETYCVRFKLNSDIHTFNDLIYGPISYDITQSEGDPIIFKSDGYPTYHFANVVDDHLMDISHVLRGVEWQISTTKHILMYKAFNWQPPLYGHLPLLMNADGTKLSKRQGDIRISHYRDNGILPLALLNFIVNSGGGFDKDLERHAKPKCFTIEELAQQFDISRVNTHSGKLMPERLSEFNRLELWRQLENEHSTQELLTKLVALVKRTFPSSSGLELQENYVKNILIWGVNRITKLEDLVSSDLKFVWMAPNLKKIEAHELKYLELFLGSFERRVVEKEALNVFIKEFCQRHELKFAKFMRVLRLALSGLKEGPSVAEIMEILGKETTMERLRQSIEGNTVR